MTFEEFRNSSAEKIYENCPTEQKDRGTSFFQADCLIHQAFCSQQENRLSVFRQHTSGRQIFPKDFQRHFYLRQNKRNMRKENFLISFQHYFSFFVRAFPFVSFHCTSGRYVRTSATAPFVAETYNERLRWCYQR